MIAPYFLPRRRVGALRPFKFAIHLRDFGWEPHILTIASDGQLTSKEERLLQNISVYNLKPPFDRTGHSGSQQTKSTQKKQKSNFIADWIDRHFPVDTWLPFFRFKFGEIKRIAREVDPDAIWSTGDPWSAHWVGKKLSSLLPDTFWMADFRDPWTVSETDLKERSAFASAVDRRIERKWIQKASMLSFTTDSTKKLYEKHYSELNLRATTIYNAFDRELFNNGDEEESVDLNFDPEKLNIIFFGRFRRLSPARPVIDILSQLKSNDPSAADKIRVHSFGSLTDPDNKYLSEKGIENCFETHEPVPVEQGLQVLQQADILLLSTNPERTAIIPAKLWDYLAAGQPILSIAPNPEIEAILKETGSGIQYSSQNPEEVAEVVKNCLTAKEKGQALPISYAPDQQKIDQYGTQSATAKLVNILEQHTG